MKTIMAEEISEIQVGDQVKWSGADPDKAEENVPYRVVAVGGATDDWDYIIQRPNHPKNLVRHSEIVKLNTPHV